MKLKKEDDSDTFDILTYSVDSMPQLLNSTLLRIPEDDEEDEEDDIGIDDRNEMISRNAIGNSIKSQKIEVTYNSDGLPETRRISPYIYNLYGVNGERYVYNENKQMTALYYLDVNGEPICNQEGIMMVSFEYGEENKVTDIRYFSDENGEERIEGFHGVFCEKYEYDSDGNLCGRKQVNTSGNHGYDKNGVCEYRYTYIDGKLKREEFLDFSGNAVYNKKVRSTWLAFEGEQDDTGNKTVKVLLEPIIRLAEQDTLEPAASTEGSGNLKGKQDDAIPVISDDVNMGNNGQEEDKEKGGKRDTEPTISGYEDDGAGNRKNAKTASEKGETDNSFNENNKANTENSNTSQPDKREGETPVRGYTEVHYTVKKNEKELEITYHNGEVRVKNERGFSGERLNYDHKFRVEKKTYLDIENKPCKTVGGYSRVVFRYISENGDEKECVEYYDDNEKLAINKKEGYGYAVVEYKPYEGAEEREEEHTFTLEYRDQNDKLLRLPEKGYAKVRQTYNARGLLVRETYYTENETEDAPAYRSDYRVAGIDCEYSDDGNLICEIYRDKKGQEVNRYDTGFAMRFQEFENGKLVKIYYKGYVDDILQDVPNKKYGVGSVKYIYANGHRVEEQYFDINGAPALLSNYGYAVRKIEYDNRGLETAVRFYGTDGELIFLKGFGYATVTFQYDEWGRQIFEHYYGIDQKPIISTQYYCAGRQFQYDENGNCSVIRYLDKNNNLMMRRDLGYAEIRKEYNADGKIIKEQYFDSDGQPVACKEGGYAVYEGYYDGENLTRVEYKDKNHDNNEDEFVLHKDREYAVVEYEYDDNGKCIKEKLLGVDGEAIISKKYQCAGFRHEYDEEKNQKTTWYLDSDGYPMIRSDLGYAKVCKKYDEFENLIEESYYDMSSEPILCKEGGYASFVNEYDAQGNCVRTIYRDVKGKPTLRKDAGYAVVENIFDDFGRCIRVSYYGKNYDTSCNVYDDANETALIYNDEYGCAAFRYQYDAIGNTTDISYTDIDGNIMVRRDIGFAKKHCEYDEQGNLIGECYYDANNDPTTRREGGYASFKKTYKDGKCIEAVYYDTDGHLVLRNDQGFAIERWQYDELGQCISDAFYDTKGKPVINKKYMCAVFEYEYDSRGYQTDIWYRDTDGEIMIRPDLGCAHMKKEYDNRGNQIKGFYYDKEERLTLSKDRGIAYFVDDFDEEGNLIERRYYGKNRELKLRREGGYAVVKYSYDAYGRQETVDYCGTDGKTPVISTKYHCAGFRYEYDETGDTETTTYVGLDGDIMSREDLGYAKQIVETVYDSETNRTTERGYFRNSADEPAEKAEGGYTGYEDIYVCGKWVESRFYVGESKSNWKLTERTGKGYAVIKKDYDQFWQCISESYYDAEEKPVCYLEKEKKICAKFEYAYDDRGNRISIIYKDTSDNKMIRSDYGYAQVCSEFDEQGNITEERYYDVDENLIDRTGGYSSVDWFYDNGYCTETRYYDADKKLIQRSDEKYAIQREQCDEFGQRILSSYFGVDGEPVVNSLYGCSIFEYQYDPLGNETDIIYRDTEGSMTVRENRGFAWVHQKYDEWGRLVMETYYDAEGKPTTDVEGYPGKTYVYTYDEQGNEKKELCDLDGNPIN